MTFTAPTGRAYRMYNDMLRQTHLLIAGATGSGKSTIVNGLIATALYRTPRDVGFMLIDPKRVELREYIELPHTLSYTNRLQDVPQAMRAVLQIVNARLADMEKKKQRMYEGSDIYVIIDELMPLMVQADVKREVLPILQEVLAIARCARVHIIACTQSPVCAVLPTPLKCNFSSIIALRTVNAQDSRNIIGSRGCERFPDPQVDGKAYAYFRHGPSTDMYEVPRYTDAERQRLVNWWACQA